MIGIICSNFSPTAESTAQEQGGGARLLSVRVGGPSGQLVNIPLELGLTSKKGMPVLNTESLPGVTSGYSNIAPVASYAPVVSSFDYGQNLFVNK